MNEYFEIKMSTSIGGKKEAVPKRNITRKTMLGAATYPFKHSLNQFTFKINYNYNAIWQQLGY
jgi:hypothetical protein